MSLESWRRVWRDGVAPQLSTAGLEALAIALRDDDSQLRQGTTTSPPPLMCVRDFPCEGADAIGFAGWKGDGLTTVGEVEENFARVCFQSDQATAGPADCRLFLNWYDDTPRPEMRRELAHEVGLAIVERKGILTRLNGPIPDGFTKAFVANNCEESADYAVLADWLDENERPSEAAMCRDAALIIDAEATRAT